MLYTGGSEGIIRVWKTPQESEVNPYGDTKNGQNYCIAQWSEIEKEREAIWDLQYHPFQKLLLSVSAPNQNSVLLWNCEDVMDGSDRENPGKIIHRFGTADVTSTCCSWLNTQQNQFAVAQTSGKYPFDSLICYILGSATIELFDTQTGQMVGEVQMNQTGAE